MKVLIATLGTRGDVQPYIGLSQMLASAGYSVTIASSAAHEALVRGYHIDFCCIDATKDTSLIQNVIRTKGVRAINEGVRLLFDGMFECHEKILQAAGEVDLVIGHGWLGEVEAEMCRKIFIRVGISPTIAEKVKSQAGTIAEKLRIDIERLALNRMIIKPYNDFLRKVDRGSTDLERIYAKPLLLPISKVLLGSTKLWNRRTYQSSYWYPRDANSGMPDKIAGLLSSGRKTVLLTFGSMTSGLKIENSYISEFYNLAQEMDFNLIWIGKHSFDEDYLTSERFAAVDEMPLSHILPKADVVFHHCGLGTTSEVIRSGCPSVPVPFVVDQHEWARRLIAGGLATEAVRPDRLTGKRIRRRLNSVFLNTKYKTAADLTRDIVQRELDTDETVERIERICAS